MAQYKCTLRTKTLLRYIMTGDAAFRNDEAGLRRHLVQCGDQGSRDLLPNVQALGGVGPGYLSSTGISDPPTSRPDRFLKVPGPPRAHDGGLIAYYALNGKLNTYDG